MSNDPNLNESGRINLGDIAELEKNPSRILDPTGQVMKSAARVQAEQAAKDLADKVFNSTGIAWHLDEDATEKEGKDMFFPRLAITGVSEKFGVSRPHKEFFPEERNMFMQAFMNDCGVFLFGVEPFNEIKTRNGIAFRPNKDWVNLPVHTS